MHCTKCRTGGNYMHVARAGLLLPDLLHPRSPCVLVLQAGDGRGKGHDEVVDAQGGKPLVGAHTSIFDKHENHLDRVVFVKGQKGQ